MIDRSSSCPRLSDPVPAQSHQPAAVVQGLQEPFGVGNILYPEIEMDAAAIGKPLPGIGSEQARRSRGPHDVAGLFQFRHDRSQGSDEAAALFQLVLDLCRDSLAVKIAQAEAAPSLLERQIIAAAADDAWGSPAVELFLGGDLHLVGEAGAQAPECDRLL